MNCLINSIENGGINLTDVRSKISSLKANWVLRWKDAPTWTPVANIFLNNINCNYEMCIKMNTIDLELFKKLPSFYVDVWKSFYMCKTIRNVKCINNFDFLSSIIWGNNMFINKTIKCIFCVNWIKSDIIFVKDL